MQLSVASVLKRLHLPIESIQLRGTLGMCLSWFVPVSIIPLLSDPCDVTPACCTIYAWVKAFGAWSHSCAYAELQSGYLVLNDTCTCNAILMYPDAWAIFCRWSAASGCFNGS